MNSSVDGIAKRTQYKLHVTLLQNKTVNKNAYQYCHPWHSIVSLYF